MLLHQMDLDRFRYLDVRWENRAAQILQAIGSDSGETLLIFAALCKEIAQLRHDIKLRDGTIESNRRANAMLIRRARRLEG